ncbi:MULTISPECIES: SDR family oxidoreductase [Streptomyces]|uniref:SDR family oxidoreductase n=1 Tax=Streptomyces TaxID=1883 RepID=UPI0020212118|nr:MULTISPECIES: SDR family oxidoreductase [Streptomyces]MCL7494670.1 SDR family oxidoreductase [Streptomyces sp. MCA2]
MAKICAGRVVVITGAGNGIGRAHALAFAAAGARVVVNDLGGARDGAGSSTAAAETVAAGIRAAGGEAVANFDDISSWDGARRLTEQAVERFGRLDTLVNNAGILRDRTLVGMTEQDWDAVVAVHLKGTVAVLHHAATHWRQRSKAGEEVAGRVINTTSTSGLYGNPGQSNYAAAKAGIAALTISAAQELGRYGVTVNAVAPAALTRMTEDLSVMPDLAAQHDLAPESVPPVVVWLGSALSGHVTGRVVTVFGRRISVAEGWVDGPAAVGAERWEPETAGAALDELVERAAPNADAFGKRSG